MDLCNEESCYWPGRVVTNLEDGFGPGLSITKITTAELMEGVTRQMIEEEENFNMCYCRERCNHVNEGKRVSAFDYVVWQKLMEKYDMEIEYEDVCDFLLPDVDIVNLCSQKEIEADFDSHLRMFSLQVEKKTLSFVYDLEQKIKALPLATFEYHYTPLIDIKISGVPLAEFTVAYSPSLIDIKLTGAPLSAEFEYYYAPLIDVTIIGAPLAESVCAPNSLLDPIKQSESSSDNFHFAENLREDVSIIESPLFNDSLSLVANLGGLGEEDQDRQICDVEDSSLKMSNLFDPDKFQVSDVSNVEDEMPPLINCNSVEESLKKPIIENVHASRPNDPWTILFECDGPVGEKCVNQTLITQKETKWTLDFRSWDQQVSLDLSKIGGMGVFGFQGNTWRFKDPPLVNYADFS